MKIALIQQHASKSINKNLERAVRAFETAAKQGAKVIAFAELAFTPFYPQNEATGDVSELAETVPGPITELFCQLSKKYSVTSVLNLLEKSGDKTYDSSPVIDADGTILGATHMVHIAELPSFHEKGYYADGKGDSMVYDTAVGRVGVAICYDRHFPEYMRELGRQGAELVVVPQAGAVGEWPEGLYEAELRVASFHNGYFTALCNRVGREDCLTFEGKSFISAPDGRIIAQSPALEDDILIGSIDLAECRTSFARKNFFPDRRHDLYRTWSSKPQKY
ncbi:carbon-nitrogen hydrolase family protein [Candidatus Neomarinimicrobiota bacterium]